MQSKENKTALEKEKKKEKKRKNSGQRTGIQT